MPKRYFSIFSLVSIILCVFLGVFFVFQAKKLPKPAVSGYFIQKGKWDNYGLTVNLYQEKKFISQDLTSVNGYFQFASLRPGKYQLYFFDRQYFLAKKNINYPGGIYKEKIYYQDKYYHPLFLMETLGFVLGLVFLLLSVFFFLKAAEKTFSFLVLLMAFTTMLFCGVEFFQVILAQLNYEILAALLFPLKHVGLSCFGFCFLALLLYLPQRSPFLKQAYPVFFIPLLESIIILSWSLLGSDVAFYQVWHISFNVLRLIIVSQLVLLVAASLWRLFYLERTARDLILKNKVRILFFATAAFFLLLLVFVFTPVFLLKGQEFFPGQYNLTAVIAASMLMGFVIYVVNSYQVLSFQLFLNRSVTYFIVSTILIFSYSFLIVYLDKALVNFRNYLINAYIIAFFIAVFLPLRSRIQKFVDAYFFGDYLAQRSALLSLAQSLLRCLNREELVAQLQESLVKYLKIWQVKIIILTKPEKLKQNSYFVPDSRNRPQTLPKAKSYQIGINIQDQKCYGYILLGHKKNYSEYTLSELELLQAVAAQVAVALSNIFLYEEKIAAQKNLERTQRLAAVGTLAAGLAHEIKNPLTAIHNMISLWPERNRDKSFQKSFQEIVPRQIQRINNLLNDLLSFSKQVIKKNSQVDLTAVVKKVINLLEPTARRQQVRIITSFFPKQKISGNAEALEQAFLNLAMNSLQAMPKGGELTFKIFSEDKYLAAIIKDTGRGISPKNLEKIFDPFFTTKRSGTGLGLAITYNILDQHQAKIEVKSIPNRGTEFKIFFKL